MGPVSHIDSISKFGCIARNVVTVKRGRSEVRAPPSRCSRNDNAAALSRSGSSCNSVCSPLCFPRRLSILLTPLITA
ncbi:hypothetical protein SKAU_G00283520 [Synaphobranchus kaupii]|uniref:Uncharacterized protein n=1 Tax=Synaphobranchus kaupii TaxID=118154 RepID=A0A9Q1EXL0_SYNKA|nr:hypothetical protein SKAU_G00283520 [Synaphobranchus kaupii]